MIKKEYLKVGETKVVNGEVCIKPDYFGDGLTYGTIFKDEEYINQEQSTQRLTHQKQQQ